MTEEFNINLSRPSLVSFAEFEEIVGKYTQKIKLSETVRCVKLRETVQTCPNRPKQVVRFADEHNLGKALDTVSCVFLINRHRGCTAQKSRSGRGMRGARACVERFSLGRLGESFARGQDLTLC